MKNSVNLQDVFLNQVRKDKTEITVFLVNGFQIRGTVRGFDNYTIVMDVDSRQQVIYKHAVSTMIPQTPVNFVKAEAESEDNKER